MTDYLNLAPGEQQYVWESFVSSEPGSPDEDEAFRRAERLLRPEIYRSWLYSKQKGIDPFKVKNRRLPVDRLNEVLKENHRLISISVPYMEEFLQFFDSEHYAISVTDSGGTMLALMGGIGDLIKDTMMTESLEIGTERSEDYSGTNGISVCIRHRKPVQIIGPEHYIRSQQLYTSSAAPIFSPGGDLIGCFNVFGPSEMVHPHTLGMVVTAANGMSKELQLSQSYSAMRLTSSRMAIMLELSNSGIIMADHDHIIRNHNALAERILGLAAEEIDGRPLSEVLVTDSPSVDLTAPGSDFIDREISFRLKGKSVDLNVAATTIRNSDGSSGGVVITLDEMKQIRNIVKRAGGFTARYTLDSIIGRSAPMDQCRKICRTASRSTSNVLVLGESGTGKELFAHAIHNGSDRKNGPFVAINCASIPKDLIESELFGYEGNAFTGASRNGQPGKFELADGGTIFLDEIGDMPLNMQTALLRILQSGEVTRVGGKTSKPVDVRVIAATNHDLRADAARHDFRQDLYYRLNVLSFTIPPLRKRRSDIAALVEHFIASYSGQLCKDVRGVTPGAMKLLTGYHWPGNVRELENVIERCVNLAPDMYIDVYDLPEEIRMQNAWQGSMMSADFSRAAGGSGISGPADTSDAASFSGTGSVGHGPAPAGAGYSFQGAGFPGTGAGIHGTGLPCAAPGSPAHALDGTAGVNAYSPAGYAGTARQPFYFAGGSPAGCPGSPAKNLPASAPGSPEKYDPKTSAFDPPADISTTDQTRYTIKDSERHMICSALARTAGNIQRASELLGISRRTMYNKIERYNIDIAAYRAVPPDRGKLR